MWCWNWRNRGMVLCGVEVQIGVGGIAKHFVP
jgi:hypothetical protein